MDGDGRVVRLEKAVPGRRCGLRGHSVRGESSGVRVKRRRSDESQSGRRPGPSLYRYAGMGIELAGAIIGLTLLGLWIDHRFECGPTGVLVGAILGVVGGFYNFIRQALLMMKEAEAARKGDNADRDDDTTDLR